jgi:hypothetical protein
MRCPLPNLVTGAALLAALATGAAAQEVPKATRPQGTTAVLRLPLAPPAATQPACPVPQPAAAGDAPAGFHPAGMQTPKSGAIRIVVTQGTKGGPAIGHDPVTVELFSQSHAIHTYKAQVGDGGIVEIKDIPLDVPFQPVITIEHGGAQQELIGPPMHKFQPAVELHMDVFETTAEKPIWTTGIRHVAVETIMVKGAPVLRVTEMMGGFNPVDKAWLGEKNVTLAIQLPSNAQDVVLGQGLAEANPTIANGTITRGRAMSPGSTEYDFGYMLPVTNGTATLTFTAVAPTTLFAIYMPATFHVEKCVGVETKDSSGKYGIAGRQLVVGKNLKPGQVVSVSVSGITAPVPLPVAATQPADEKTTLQLPRPAGK